MSKQKVADVSGRDHYAQIFADELEAEARWLSYGAADKVDSIAILLERAGCDPQRVLELGCGTGAVITECQRRGIGTNFTAIDYSTEAIGYLKAHSAGIVCIQADLNDESTLIEEHFDVVIISHVLEHLEDPLKLLQSLLKRISFDVLVAEVPLEDLFVSRVKARLRDRLRNPAGHVQFYTPRSFHDLLHEAGFTVLDRRNYASVLSLEAATFITLKDGLSRGRSFAKKLLNCFLPRIFGPIWRKYYYGNEAVLCVAAQLDQRAHHQLDTRTG
jgi:SAM-dependent methyltransferase